MSAYPVISRAGKRSTSTTPVGTGLFAVWKKKEEGERKTAKMQKGNSFSFSFTDHCQYFINFVYSSSIFLIICSNLSTTCI